MGKSLKKYKKPPRGEREFAEEAQTSPAQGKAMKALDIPLELAPVKKTAMKWCTAPSQEHETSDDGSEARVDSGNEGIGFEHELPSAAIPPKERVAKVATHVVSTVEDETPAGASYTPSAPSKDMKKRAAKIACSVASTSEDPAGEEVAIIIPEVTLQFTARWLPRWHAYCGRFPQPEDFAGVAPYCSAGMDLVLAFTHDVTASHISKKGLPFDVSNHTASPWEVHFNNVFYPADKIRNYIDINVRRFQMFRNGEEMEGKMWNDMDAKYRKGVDLLLEKMERFQTIGSWEKENRRVNEMVRYGVFGKVGEESKVGEQVQSKV